MICCWALPPLYIGHMNAGMIVTWAIGRVCPDGHIRKPPEPTFYAVCVYGENHYNGHELF